MTQQLIFDFLKILHDIIRVCNSMVEFSKFTLNIKIYEEFKGFLSKQVQRETLFRLCSPSLFISLIFLVVSLYLCFGLMLHVLVSIVQMLQRTPHNSLSPSSSHLYFFKLSWASFSTNTHKYKFKIFIQNLLCICLFYIF